MLLITKRVVGKNGTNNSAFQKGSVFQFNVFYGGIFIVSPLKYGGLFLNKTFHGVQIFRKWLFYIGRLMIRLCLPMGREVLQMHFSVI